jgi:hypothetical protein
MITPSTTYDDFVTSVQVALPPHKSDYIDLRDINGEQLFDDTGDAFPFRGIANGERIQTGCNEVKYLFAKLLCEVVLSLEDGSLLNSLPARGFRAPKGAADEAIKH